MTKYNFNSSVAARTRTAVHILETPDLLEKFLDCGGLPRDLEGIRDAGLAAEAANLMQNMAASDGKVATSDVLLSFASIQKEYKSVMGVVNVVRADVAREGTMPDLVTKLEGILANEAQATITTVTDSEGESKRTTRKSESQEALRAEIAKDAAALLALPEVHERLTERRVTLARLTELKSNADNLTGILAARAAIKGQGKESTIAEHEACDRQRDFWGSTYRILSALSAKDERVRSLLQDAAR